MSKTESKAKRNIGTVAREAIRAGKTNEEALAAVLKEFPNASTSLGSIGWYRNDLRAAGEQVKTAKEAKEGLPASPPGATAGKQKKRKPKAEKAEKAEAAEDNPFDS